MLDEIPKIEFVDDDEVVAVVLVGKFSVGNSTLICPKCSRKYVKKICYEKHILSCNQSKFLTKRKRKKSQAGVEEVPNMDYKNC